MPVSAFAVDTLVKGVGRMIAKLHGFPDYPYVIIPAPFLEGVMIPEDMWEEKIQDAVIKGEQLITGSSI